LYSTDLAYIHDAGFGGFARSVAADLVAILARRGIETGLVVEIGCGAGTVARRLADDGYDVLAYDVSPAMVRLARARAPRADCRVASLADAVIPPCAAIVSVGEVVTYVPGGMRVLRRFFARAYASLAPGGVLVFDFIASARGRTYPTKTLSGRDWAIAVRATVDRSARVLTRRMDLARRVAGRWRRSRETHRVRVYGVREMTLALERCGFSVEMRRSFGRRRLIAGDVAVIARKSARV